MSRFFDLLQRLNQPPTDKKGYATGLAPESKATCEVDQALSLLLSQDTGLWPSQADSVPRELSQPSTVLRAEPEEDSEFSRIPIEEVKVRPENRIALETDPGGPAADRFRLLRIRLRELRKPKELKTLLVTSPLPEEGKSTIAMNLATTLAEGGKRRVLLVEADLHRATMMPQLQLSDGPGLAECLEGGLDPLAATRRLSPLGWYLLPAGKAQSNPTELLQGDSLGKVMQQMSVHFEWILIDAPPIIPLSDALLLCRQADATVLVVRAGRTSKDDVGKAIELLGKHNLLGILLNGVDGLDSMYSRYSTYYGYGNGRTGVCASE